MLTDGVKKYLSEFLKWGFLVLEGNAICFLFEWFCCSRHFDFKILENLGFLCKTFYFAVIFDLWVFFLKFFFLQKIHGKNRMKWVSLEERERENVMNMGHGYIAGMNLGSVWMYPTNYKSLCYRCSLLLVSYWLFIIIKSQFG